MTTTDVPTAAVPPLDAPPADTALGGRFRSQRTVTWASIAALMLSTAVLYLWNLTASGYANEFYSAAAQAGSVSWKAFFFGSLDAGNSITVDKPPASLWLMALSVRLFGLNSFAILLPQALLGVASVGVLYASLRRTLSHVTRGRGAADVADEPVGMRAHWGALAGAGVFATTPVATLMFRFNNPDALLVFLLVLASYLTLVAIEKASARTLVGAGVVIGFAFLTKMMQALVILPALAAAYLVAAPVSFGKRIVHLLYAFAAVVVSAGWWIAIVELWPADSRPFIGGSQTNSVLELIIGYNGLGRITGDQVGSVTGGGGNQGGQWGETGILRMFSGVSGGMVSWLIPAALLLAIVAVILIGRAGRTDLRRAALIVWGGWLVITLALFSFMAGIYHDYYTIALTPAIGSLVGIGSVIAWEHRDRLWVRIALAVAVLGTGAWSIVLLGKASGIYLLLRWPVGLLAVVAAAGILAAPMLPLWLASGSVGIALAAGLIGPLAYSIQTASVGHTGSIVTAGPVSSGRGGTAGGRGTGGGMGVGQDGGTRTRGQGTTGQGAPGQGTTGKGTTGQGTTGSGGSTTGRPPTGTTGQAPTGQAPGTTGQAGGTTQQVPGSTGQAPGGTGSVGGGLLGGASVSSEMVSLLTTDTGSVTWVAATVGSQNAASFQLATQRPVMALGGFNGSDPSPTLEQFTKLVSDGQVRYFIAGSIGGRQNGGSDAAAEIQAWVEQNFTATTVGSSTVYDLQA